MLYLIIEPNLHLSCLLKGVVQREGNKLKTTLKNIVSVTELVDANTLISVSSFSDFIFFKVFLAD